MQLERNPACCLNRKQVTEMVLAGAVRLAAREIDVENVGGVSGWLLFGYYYFNTGLIIEIRPFILANLPTRVEFK